MGRGTRRDWRRIKAEFCEGVAGEAGERSFPTLQQLADKYSIDRGFLRSQAAREGWQDAKRQLATIVDQQRLELHAGRAAVQAVALDLATLETAAQLLVLVRARLDALSDATPPKDMDLSIARLAGALRVVQLIGIGARSEGDENVTNPILLPEARTIRVVYERTPMPGTAAAGDGPPELAQ